MAEKPIRVLLIEDSSTQASLIRDFLERSGASSFEVCWEDRLSTGLNLLAQGGIDIVLLDLTLPDAEGLESFNRAYAQAPGVPIVVLTGLEDESVAAQALQNGAQDYLAKKEVRHDSLVRSLRYAIERKRLEVELRHAQRLEAVGGLAAGIAHEINTPIQFIGDGVYFLQQAFDDLAEVLRSYRRLPATAANGGVALERFAAVREVEEEADWDYLETEIPKAFRRTLEGVNQVATIVRAMKEFSHPSQKQKEPADLNQALNNTLTVARNEYKYAADVKTEFSELPAVKCHLADLNQVFLNLIINASHAIAEVVGDGEEKKGLITVRSWREDGHACISIADTGCGIPESVRSRVFDPFFTTKEVGRGTGQGLAIARSIVVDKHGGNLSFETQVGRGTTFLVRLPFEGGQAGRGPDL